MTEGLEFSLEFLYSDLRLGRGSGKDSNDVTKQIHAFITEKSPLNEEDILAVQYLPSSRRPNKVMLFCKNSKTKNTLKQIGLDLFGSAITLDEPGSGMLKVEIQNVLHSVPNHLIWQWMDNFGITVDVKSEKHKFKCGRRVSWGSGIRTVWIKHVKRPIPPVGSIAFKNRNINFSVWYFGQTGYEMSPL